MTKTLLYKFSKSLVPCLLITLSIGFTYAFSLFAPHIAQHLDASKHAVQLAFCLNIFWLGLGAALFGKLIQSKIKTSAVISTALLFCGLCLSGLGMQLKSLWMLYIGFGFCCGIAEGIGYVTPVLNNILWFGRGKFKGLVASLSIVSFGLGSTLCSMLFKVMMPVFGIEWIFFAYGILYLAMMSIGTAMISKPKYAKASKKVAEFSYMELFRDSYARKSWLYMFLNISMGLVLIGSCASILQEIHLSSDMIIIVMMLCGVFNGAGRLVFPLLSDLVCKRVTMLLLVLGLEIAVMIPAAFSYALIPLSIVIINATYGSFFAMLPSVLSDHYGNKSLSIRHSAILSSWGFASLFAFACTSIMTAFCSSYYFLTVLLPIVYVVNFFIVKSLAKQQ